MHCACLSGGLLSRKFSMTALQYGYLFPDFLLIVAFIDEDVSGLNADSSAFPLFTACCSRLVALLIANLYLFYCLQCIILEELWFTIPHSSLFSIPSYPLSAALTSLALSIACGYVISFLGRLPCHTAFDVRHCR